MADVLFEKRGKLGLITLNRPKALNALTTEMCALMHRALLDFAADNPIAHVLLRSSENGRFFRAGGDIRSVYTHMRNKTYDTAEVFFATEYRLNHQIARYPKPYISLLDGIVMGGGVGISSHGTYRIATPNTIYAMPEVAIGFFPDVGASFPLSRLPHHIGAYLVVTGERIKGEDMVFCGLATHFADPANHDALLEGLASSADTQKILSSYSMEPPPSALAAAVSFVEKYFCEPSVEKIHEALVKDRNMDFAKRCLDVMAGRSPTSMIVALRQIIEAPRSIEETLRRDYRIVCRIIRDHDFAEGVRAVVIDKDQNPRWQPATMNAIEKEKIDSYFASLPQDEELDFA